MKIKLWFTLVAVAFLLALGGCSPKPVEFDLSVTVTLDGHPLADADVFVDGAKIGKTDEKGDVCPGAGQSRPTIRSRWR